MYQKANTIPYTNTLNEKTTLQRDNTSFKTIFSLRHFPLNFHVHKHLSKDSIFL